MFSLFGPFSLDVDIVNNCFDSSLFHHSFITWCQNRSHGYFLVLSEKKWKIFFVTVSIYNENLLGVFGIALLHHEESCLG